MTIQTITIAVFTAYKDGRPLCFDNDFDNLLKYLNTKPDAKDITVHQCDEEVGTIMGKLVDWNAEEPGQPRLKLHWVCPQCGMEQWEDWSPDHSNPYLCGSMCRCIDMWLVCWESGESKRERS